MGAGSKITLKDFDSGNLAKVVGGRLLVSVSGGGSGPTANVNISAIGGNLVTTTVPVSGTVTALQGTSPWVVSFPGGVSVTQGTSPWVVSGTVAATQSGAWTVAVSNFPATQPVSGTVTALQGTSPWVVSGTVAVSNFPATVAVTQSTSPWVVSGTVAVAPIWSPLSNASA